MANTQEAVLPANAVHIWRFPLIAARQEISGLAHWLSKHERETLDRIISCDERDKRIVAWGRLRYILSRYLGCAPGDIQIKREPLGRPEIVYPKSEGLRFSLSHSKNMGLIGVACCAVGVDIEKIQPMMNVERLVARFFSPDEATKLRSLPEAEQVLSFFRLWVLKEAYLKAIGAGVPAGLSKCEIALHADGPLILRSEFEGQQPQYALIEIPVSKGYVAALASLKQVADVSVFDL